MEDFSVFLATDFLLRLVGADVSSAELSESDKLASVSVVTAADFFSFS